jgi:alkanesulfonate monooxygenase SsuD/methylene tetrahydromethanopterin reductase-like flavin-dependent oxidoreductase (luciferase family)
MTSTVTFVLFVFFVVHSLDHRKAGPMKIGVLQFFSWPDRQVPLAAVYQRAIERFEIMDRAGYDAVWLAEHHFSGFSVCPSVHMMATLAAARTQRLRIGTAVSLAPFYHPLRLAEEVALLDVLSGGRVNWGAGRGFARVEFDAFGVPIEESAARFRETVEVVLGAWTSERLSHRGAQFTFEGVEVLPKPLQQPHPPVWMAATSESAIDWAAGRGFSILMDPHCTRAELADKRRRYGEGMAAAGFTAAGRDIPMARLMAIAPTAERAEAVARRGAEWTVGAYIGQGRAGGADPVQRYVDQVITHGTPDAVIDQIRALEEEAQLNYLLCAPLSQESFTLLTDKVLPALG